MSISPSLLILGSDNVRAATVAVVDTSGNQLSGFDASRPATATLTQVAAASVSTILLAANTARRRFMVHNSANKTVFLAFAATASLTAYSLPVPAGQSYEGPLNDYTGIVTFIGAAGINTNNLFVTEITT